MESFYHIEHKEHKDIRRRQGFGGQGGPKNEFFFVIFVIFVVKNLLKFFAFRRLRWNDAGYKNNLKIIVVLMNIYAIVYSNEWLIEAMMKN